jgi:hypothetical protein
VCVSIYIYIYIYIYKKRLGLSRVLPGQLPSGFLLRPGSVPGPGRLGPGSTRQAGSGFKTMVPLSTIQDRSFKKALFGGEPFFFFSFKRKVCCSKLANKIRQIKKKCLVYINIQYNTYMVTYNHNRNS